MRHHYHEDLPIGRAALAKTISVEWVVKHRSSLLMSAGTLVVCLFLLSQGKGVFSRQSSDYFAAEAAYAAWSAQEVPDAHLLKRLEAPLKRHPELESKFGGLIAQRLLGFHQVKEAEPYAKGLWKRTRGLLSSYQGRFSSNSLTMARGEYEGALAEALSLKEQMLGDSALWQQGVEPKGGSLLYAYNLMRIAALQRQVGSIKGELAAWEEWICNAGWEVSADSLKTTPLPTYDPGTYSALAAQFQEGSISLFQFIEHRKITLRREL